MTNTDELRKAAEAATPGQKLINSLGEALAIAKGEQPAASYWIGGFEYVPALRLAALEAENARMIEALTPSGETKAAYIGEFKFCEARYDFNEDIDVSTVYTVPWTTIKEIMAEIRNRARLTTGEEG